MLRKYKIILFSFFLIPVEFCNFVPDFQLIELLHGAYSSKNINEKEKALIQDQFLLLGKALVYKAALMPHDLDEICKLSDVIQLTNSTHHTDRYIALKKKLAQTVENFSNDDIKRVWNDLISQLGSLLVQMNDLVYAKISMFDSNNIFYKQLITTAAKKQRNDEVRLALGKSYAAALKIITLNYFVKMILDALDKKHEQQLIKEISSELGQWTELLLNNKTESSNYYFFYEIAIYHFLTSKEIVNEKEEVGNILNVLVRLFDDLYREKHDAYPCFKDLNYIIAILYSMAPILSGKELPTNIIERRSFSSSMDALPIVISKLNLQDGSNSSSSFDNLTPKTPHAGSSVTSLPVSSSGSIPSLSGGSSSNSDPAVKVAAIATPRAKSGSPIHGDSQFDLQRFVRRFSTSGMNNRNMLSPISAPPTRRSFDVPTKGGTVQTPSTTSSSAPSTPKGTNTLKIEPRT